MTKTGKELKSLKEKLSGYGIDPFTLVYIINLSRREKIAKIFYNEILGKEKLNEFLQERLINGKCGFLDTVKPPNSGHPK